MSGITLDWAAIRPLNGGRDKGFEELCSQLARAEAPAGARFVRKGTPDAGVECYAEVAETTEWGWQAKYFDVLGDSQWKQLDESVQAAIEKHPKLCRYYVCVPLDLADARIVGKKTGKAWRSAKDQWVEHVAKWQRWAHDMNRTIEFSWWGSSELLLRLARPENFGRVRFWFDKRGFDGDWFSARLDEAIKAAGPRYTPQLHVDLSIAEDLDAFGRTKEFFDRVKALAIPVRKALEQARDSDHSIADGETAAMNASFFAAVQTVLNALGAISQVAAGPLPFRSVAGMIEASNAPALALAAHLEKRAEEHDAQQSKDEFGDGRHRANPFRSRCYTLRRLERELSKASEALRHADEFATSTTLILRGDPGTGKTHLLCDVVKRRVEAHQPTVLLMGQRFVSYDAPWYQVLQQLDLAGLSAEEFVGALEAAAQASGERALVAIDAINEGTGRVVWPTHLAAFLAHLERSPWIGVVLSVRSSYEHVIIPTEVRDRSLIVTHHGFHGREYDAAKAFFVHYGLELPSTPHLAHEFQNPLFLKTLCLGLKKQGQQRLPRGFHGISDVFAFYLDAVNEALAQQLGYDVRTPLVRRAVDAIAAALVDANDRSLERERATQVVDALLPNRGFEHSLFRGLIAEGVLVEDSLPSRGKARRDVVYIAYERLADHVVANFLLDKVPTPSDWTAAFSSDGVLSAAFADDFISPGLLEALFIQVAERANSELLTFAPQLATRLATGRAFRQSLIWRSNTAFSEATRKVLDELCRNEHDLRETLEALLTVATIPEHPFNALFLDHRLRKSEMAERDAWWSTYLYSAQGGRGAVDRVIEWAWALGSTASIAEAAVDLCGIVLAWTLTTSHRFLRDRATKALVNLYTGRLEGLIRLVERFSDVDDPYVAERVYGVAYGVSMSSQDAAAVGDLAASVFRHVFASGSPAPHVLLRDYARGVVERAIHLGSKVEFDVSLARPPYKSAWPAIPSEADVTMLLEDWSKGSFASGELEWSRNIIAASVMGVGDFARYVIGTNSSSGSRSWLALRLNEAACTHPPSIDQQLSDLVADLSDDERAAWLVYEHADLAYAKAALTIVMEFLKQRDRSDAEGRGALALGRLGDGSFEAELEKFCPSVADSRRVRDAAVQALEAVLSPVHAGRLKEIWDIKKTEQRTARPPRFDLGQVQRYILSRVFELGWTVERFGYFDRFVVGHDGRSASKPERMGKKYQWIAYHEIIASLADHYQYRRESRDNGGQSYQGPWQEDLRDIDPSCTLRALPGGTLWQGHTPAWWGVAAGPVWDHGADPREWVARTEDLPRVEDLLICVDSSDGSRWLSGCGYFKWREEAPADYSPNDVPLGELWYIANAYLVRTKDVDAFLKWSETVDFWGRWMPDPPQVYGMFLGEHGWAPAFRYFQADWCGDDGWIRPGHECPVSLRQVGVEYVKESSDFDCSVDDGYTLRLPSCELISKLGLHWTGRGADFSTASGDVLVQDPSASAPGPGTLLLREDALSNLQQREQLTLCWAILGEKRVTGAWAGGPHHPTLRLSGAYVLDGSKLRGFVKRMLEDWVAGELRLIDTHRTEP